MVINLFRLAYIYSYLPLLRSTDPCLFINSDSFEFVRHLARIPSSVKPTGAVAVLQDSLAQVDTAVAFAAEVSRPRDNFNISAPNLWRAVTVVGAASGKL